MTTNLVAVGQRASSNLVYATENLNEISDQGTWVVLAYFNTPVVAFRFDDWSELDQHAADAWSGVGAWQSLQSRSDYINLVEEARRWISEGDIYQVNVCRQLRSKLPEKSDLFSVYKALQGSAYAENLFYIRLDEEHSKVFGTDRVEILSFSPEVFLHRNGDTISTRPIKGTAKVGDDFLKKDIAENIMIVDLMRNDLSKICKEDTISVPDLLQREELPYASQLVSEVAGKLRRKATWAEIFSATFPPGSVTGAPKSSALKFIAHYETDRNIYCGAFGVLDAANDSALLKVAIRTFWKQDGYLYYGAGAGITWESEAQSEWEETELKAQTLLQLLGEPS